MYFNLSFTRKAIVRAMHKIIFINQRKCFGEFLWIVEIYSFTSFHFFYFPSYSLSNIMQPGHYFLTLS